LGGRGRWISELETSLVYRVSSRTATATQRNPVSKKKKKKKKKKERKSKENKTHFYILKLSFSKFGYNIPTPSYTQENNNKV
jgi:hypothetical protein